MPPVMPRPCQNARLLSLAGSTRERAYNLCNVVPSPPLLRRRAAAVHSIRIPTGRSTTTYYTTLLNWRQCVGRSTILSLNFHLVRDHACNLAHTVAVVHLFKKALAPPPTLHRGGITHLAELQQDDVGYLKKRRRQWRRRRSAAGSRWWTTTTHFTHRSIKRFNTCFGEAKVR